MNFYQSLGFLVFGSRLRRLSDAFLHDVSRIYKSHNIAFDASWFPVFYILSQQSEVSISDIAGQLEVSHSAASQLVSNLQEKGLVTATVAADDARRKVVRFTAKGKKILDKVRPVWTALQQAMEELIAEGPDSKKILNAVSEIEAGLARQPLLERIENKLA